MVSSSKIVVMGVCACGKSTVGDALAQRIGADFMDGDTLHPPTNIEKMSAGMPLEDADRWPWLRQVGATLRKKGNIVIGCSALKRAYRDVIREEADAPVMLLHLTGSRQLLAERMAHRPGHFMPMSLLDSQLATLEPLQEDEDGIAIDIDRSVEDIVDIFLSGRIRSPAQ